MSAAQSLRASSDAFFKLGREFDAIFSREMADQAERSGDHLFRKWAADQEARVQRFTKGPGVAEQAPPAGGAA